MANIEGCFLLCFNMIVSTLLWIFLLLELTSYNHKRGLYFPHIIILYSIYLVLQFISTVIKKCRTAKNIETVLKANIEKKFTINFDGEAYHEENDSVGEHDSITYKQTIQYFFKSGSDCSMIIIDSEDIKHRRYLNLEFDYIVICADDMTYKEKSESYDTFSNEISNKDKKAKVNIK